jgi:hypothetical protein
MEFIQPIADLLGISPGMLIALTVLGVVAVIGWYVLKAALKITWKFFVAGVVVIGLGLLTLLIGAVALGAFG